MAAPQTLDEAYERYLSGKTGFGRHDMIGFMVEEIKALQARIGGVDEAAVADVVRRLDAWDVALGNALRSPSPEETSEVMAQFDATAPKPRGWPKGKPRHPKNGEAANG